MAQALVGTDVRLADIRAALATAEGLPRRSTVVGGPDYLPLSYSPGAPGWTDNMVEPPFDTTTPGQRAIEIPSDMRRLLGRTVKVGARDIVVPATGTLINVTRKPSGIPPRS